MNNFQEYYVSNNVQLKIFIYIEFTLCHIPMVDFTSFFFRLSFDLGMSVKNEVINNYTFFYSLKGTVSNRPVHFPLI